MSVFGQICVTRRCANRLSDIIDLLRIDGSKHVAFAVREHFTGNLTWGGLSVSQQ